MDTTGIRQKEIEDIPNPMNVASMAGIEPINALPLSVCLQYMYCDAIFIPAAMRNAITGIPAHKIIVKKGMDSFA
jgi:hypothetical protein